MEAVEAPPIRYSVGQDDFNPEVGRRLRILCDGVEQKEVIEYDCDAGTVLRYELGDDGKPQLNEDKSEIVRKTVTGIVTVEWDG